MSSPLASIRISEAEPRDVIRQRAAWAEGIAPIIEHDTTTSWNTRIFGLELHTTTCGDYGPGSSCVTCWSRIVRVLPTVQLVRILGRRSPAIETVTDSPQHPRWDDGCVWLRGSQADLKDIQNLAVVNWMKGTIQMEVQKAAGYSDYPGSTNPQKQCRRHRVTPGYSGKHDVAKIWGKISELSLASGDSEFYNGDAVAITTEILLGLEEEDQRIDQTFMLAFGHRCYAGLVFAAPWTTISFIPHPQSFDFYSQWEKSGLTFGEGHSGSARRVIEGLGSFHQQEMVLHSDAWTTPGTVKLKDLPFICFTIRCCRPTLGTTGGAGMEGMEICWTEKTIGARELEFEWQDTELKVSSLWSPPSRIPPLQRSLPRAVEEAEHSLQRNASDHLWSPQNSDMEVDIFRISVAQRTNRTLESGSGSNPKNTDGFAFPLPSLAYRILGYRAKMWWTMSLLCDVSVMCGGGKRIYLEVAIVQLHVLSVICRWTGMLNVHKGTTDHELNMTQADGFPRGLGGSSWSGDRSDLCWAFHAQFVEAVVCQVQRWKPMIHKSK
ncbi:hypothetical protein C8F04DRAFT_1295565 [Mycena alexandri]|uniref:Uncharacterized protein n=1 Tax=Mycena alexandri TaxID=1745969 RepID=A0AAD6WTX3_9AGAR|nr:hypothetical protein C8F04DRAFT_1295565 [Mycena alexandri]